MKRLLKVIYKQYCKTVGRIMLNISNHIDSCIITYQKSKFKHCGKDVSIALGRGIYTYSTISIGDDVFIGANAVMQSKYNEIKIGNHVAFGPCVHIFGANHDIYHVGQYMKSIGTKDNGDIIIEDDCWIGSNVTILRGVHIGRGSVIGAGAVVSKDVPPYSIYTGIHDVKVRKRFSDDDIKLHETMLNGKSE